MMQRISPRQRRKGTAGQLATMFAKRLAKGVLVDRTKPITVKKVLPTKQAPKGLR